MHRHAPFAIALASASFMLAAAAHAAPRANGGTNGSGSKSTPTPGVTQVTLAGVVRDFKAYNTSGGHPDFESTPTQGRGTYLGMVADTLNSEGDPTFASTGYKATTLAHDALGTCIIGSKPYIAHLTGDSPAIMASLQGGAVDSAHSFSSWFKDVPGVNMSAVFPLTVNVVNGAWSFDGDLRTQFSSMQGYGGNKVFGYTFELEASFSYNSAANDTITVGADDCLWVYVDGKLVIDLGGAHDFAEQTINLNRLGWLSDGQQYNLKIFYAERRKGDSRLKVVTTAGIRRVSPPPVSGLHD